MNSGRWTKHFTEDEEKLVVGIVEQRDSHGFGLDRFQLQVMARAWAKPIGLIADCGKMWCCRWLKRAKLHKP
jgi:hypothetical protein